MDYDNTGIQSDYNVNFDWIQDVVREIGDSDEILMNKNREKHNFIYIYIVKVEKIIDITA